MSSPIVILDACVLYPAALRSLLMYLAVEGAIQARWSARIHEEWITAVLRERADLTRPQLERTRALMDQHALGAVVEGYEPHIEKLVLPDPNDRHVLAAAIESGAEAIVTWNVSDFPPEPLAEFGIEVLTPDELIMDLLLADAGLVLTAMQHQRASLKNPPLTVDEYLEALKKQGLKKAVKWLADSKVEI